MFDIEKIEQILPQRYPFLMIDRVLELEPRKKVVAIKNVTINEDYFQGHFLAHPVLPGALIIESMAQAAIILFYQEGKPAAAKENIYYLGSVKVKFISPVTPGDQLVITVEPVKIITGAAIVTATAAVEGKVAAQGELSFSVKNA